MLIESDHIKNIKMQLEYYFGDYNYPKDGFLRRNLDEDGYAPISLILGFN